MSTIAYKLNKATYSVLCEALRRFQCFHVEGDRNKKWNLADLQSAWTGLGYASEYRPAIAGGYMTAAGKYAPRCQGWFKLTEKGAKIVLQWHKDGYKAVDYELTDRPPQVTPV
jgi:hypothetical protein